MTTATNSPVLAVCYAQGWCADSTQMTDREAYYVTNIGTAFKGNTSITHFEEFEYFTGLKTIPNEAFNGCTKLKSFKIPKGVTTINYRAFYNVGTNGSATTSEIVIPDTVTTIGNDAFRASTKIQRIVVPRSVTSIGSNAFVGIKTFCWDSPVNPNGTGDGAASAGDATSFTSNYYTVVDGMLVDGTKFFASPIKKTNAYIPNGIVTIGDHAFISSSTSGTIVIPEGVQTIQYRAFYGKAQGEVILPNSILAVYQDAFRSGNWHKLYLPPGLREVHGSCFANSGNYTNIVVLNKTTPPTTDSRYSFTTGNNYHYIAYVPQGSIANHPIAANKFFDVWYVQEVREMPSWFDTTNWSTIQTSLTTLYNQQSLIVKATISIETAGSQQLIIDSSTCDAIYINGVIHENITDNWSYTFSNTGTFNLRYVMNTSEYDSSEVFGNLPITIN